MGKSKSLPSLDDLAEKAAFDDALRRSTVLSWLFNHPEAVSRVDEYMALREEKPNLCSRARFYIILERQFGELPFVQHTFEMFFARRRWERWQGRLNRG